MGLKDKLAEATRAVMHKVHLGQNNNEAGRTRMQSLLSEQYLRLEPGFFKGKVCADIGCGSNGAGSINLLNLGASHVFLVDVNSSFIDPATRMLKQTEGYFEKSSLVVANAAQLPFEDSSIDFILCQGVLHHMTLENEKKALSEFHRVLRPGGKCYVSRIGSGGLISNFVMKTMRDEYATNSYFKEWADNEMSTHSIREILKQIAHKLTSTDSSAHAKSVRFLDALSDLIDDDLILTLEDRIFAPTYRQMSNADFIEILNCNSFHESYRVSTLPFYKNIRLLTTPFIQDFQSRESRILYGDGGMMNYVISKQGSLSAKSNNPVTKEQTS